MAISGLYFFILVFSILFMVNNWIEYRRWLNSNLGPLVLEVTALPNEPQPLLKLLLLVGPTIKNFIVTLKSGQRSLKNCQTINKLWIYYPNWRIFTKSGHTNPGSNNLGLIIPPKFESQKSLKLKLARKWCSTFTSH